MRTAALVKTLLYSMQRQKGAARMKRMVFGKGEILPEVSRAARMRSSTPERRARAAPEIYQYICFMPNKNQPKEFCTHRDQIREVTPSAKGCEDCLKTGDSWVHLRLCLTCGHVGCCDSSKNKHAMKHFHTTGHPIIKSFEPGEDWRWCYIDEIVVEYP